MIKVSSFTGYLVPYSLVLCFADMCSSWFTLDCYSSIYNDKYPGYSLHHEVGRCLRNMVNLLADHQQKTYTLLKMWPSLVIGSILRDLESSPDFLITITKDLDPILKRSSFYIDEVATILGPTHAMMRLELAGLWKTMGHPIVDMDASTSNWVKKGTILKRGLEPAAELIDNMFKKEFCRQFYKTHKKWPNLTMREETPDHIKACYHSNEWGETTTLKWDPEDFKHVTLLKCFEFNYHIDAIDIISDKAIIPRLPEWIHEYDTKAFRTLHGHFPRGPSPTTKSVVMHYLTSEIFDCKEILTLIDSGIIPSDWRVMVAVPKEREFKEKDARCFGKMTPEMRAYQVVTEKNIADIIFRYIKHQSMTLSEEQLTKTLNRMSCPGEGHDYVNIIIDFSSWCTHFRAELLEPLFSSLDSLFGLKNVYRFTHTFPLISTLLFQDRYAPPSQGCDDLPCEWPRCVRGPEAWLEGLRQKGWTLATILIILRAAHMCDTTASLLGQGDNQVIVLRIPSSKYLQDRRLSPDQYTQQFLRVLENICEQSGIVIKVPESWKSRRLLEYGRRYFVDGVQVSCALKKVSRLTSEANQSIHTLNTVIAGLFSSGTSIAGDDLTPIPAYMITVFEAALTLWRCHSEYRTQSNEWMATLLLMNRSVGGYPTVLFPQFALRATQDTLSLGFSVMKHLLTVPSLRGEVFRLLDITKPVRVDPLQLIKDPGSIPLNIPPQPENMFRRKLKEGLPSIVKNQSLTPIFGMDADREEECLKNDLLAIQPINPKLMCKLWQLSNVGVREKVIGKFATSRSIQTASLGTWIDEKALKTSIDALQVRTANYYIKSKNRPFTRTLDLCECVTQLTQLTRETLWDLQLEGITMPTPRDKITIIPWSKVTEELVPSSIMIGWSGSRMQNSFFPQRASDTIHWLSNQGEDQESCSSSS